MVTKGKNYRAGISLCFLLAAGFVNLAHAHYPHDTHEFIELSTDFANDHTAFIASRQVSSTRPVTALVSRDAGATWEFNAEGMNNIGKLTSAIASPLYQSDKTVLLTSDGQGVFRTINGGLKWEKFNNGLPNLRLHASAAALDSGGVTYFVSSTGGGLYRLPPAASTWVQVLAPGITATSFAVSPNFALDQTVVVGDQNGSLLLSTDAGSNFAPLALSIGTGQVSQIEFAADYATSGEIFIGTTAGLYVSSDFLASLINVPSVGTRWVSALALSPDYRSDATIFLTTPTAGVFKSIDRGVTWDQHETGVPLVAQTSYHFHDLKVSANYANDGTVFLATFEGMFRSNDFGIRWIELETRPPSLVMSVALSPSFAQDGMMLVSTYGGGLYVSEDAGANWRVSNTGVTSPYGYEVAIREGAGADPILLSSHSNHLLLSADRGLNWVEKEISDLFPGPCIASKMGVSPDYVNDNVVYLGCRKDGIVVTHDGGETWTLALNAQQLAGGTVTSIALSPDYAIDHTLMFAIHLGYFAKSIDEGVNWQLTQNGLPTPGTWYGGSGVDFSPNYANDQAIAAATEKGFYGTIDGGLNWLATPDSSSPVHAGVIENISISPDFANDQTVLTSVRGQGLFRTEDSSLSWQQVGVGNLVNRYDIQNVVFSPDFSNDGLVIGYGHDHLFRSTDRGDNFELFDIPFVRHEDNRKQSVLYQGSWQEIKNSLVSGTTFRVSQTTGNEVSLRFVGTGVRWIGVLADVLGIADVYLDDVLVATIDQYSATAAVQQELYAAENLPPGTHQIRVVVKGEKNPASLANWVLIDAFDVTR